MNKQVHIETDRLRILPFDESCLTERYVAWLNDPQVVRFSELRHTKHTLASCRAYLEAIQCSENIFLSIHAKDAGLHIGNATVTSDTHNTIADVSIIIGDRSFWSKGLGSEAFSSIVEYVLGSGEFHKVTAGAMAINIPMLAAIRQCGMQEEGRRKKHYLHEGEAVDIVYGARWREDA